MTLTLAQARSLPAQALAAPQLTPEVPRVRYGCGAYCVLLSVNY